MHRTLLPSRAVGLVAAALLGGVVALGGAAALGRLGDKTTIIREEAAPDSSAPASFQSGKQESINQIYRASAPGVVHIETTLKVQQSSQPFFGNPFGTTTQTERALGSGFVIDRAGHLVTNYHVVRGATTSLTVLIGIAKPMPTFPCVTPPVSICALTPITSPCASSSGPPELPWLSAASVWIT